jgi:HJR/Mrr/RecB family endonuclease
MNSSNKEFNSDESQVERLRGNFIKSHWRYNTLTSTEKEALLNTITYTERPEPIDYGLSRDDVYVHCGRYPLDDGLKYAENRWGPGLIFVLIFAYVFVCLGLLYVGAFRWWGWPQAMIIAALTTVCLLVFLADPGERCVDAYRRKRSKPGYLRYQKAVELHELYQSAAQAAAHEAEQAILRRKRSYWTMLDGYEFERATAEVLKRHQFNPRVTPGSADGGIDIEVTRNGLKGVVQCKAHLACVGPHVVRDLYGVLHHSGADFGIVVSRGGFTQGAIDFARGKPILFLDVSDLIAMQQGRDVLAAAFGRSET